ncbi:hypothetical protein ACI6Q2_15390 [Chitinophagaceae bacterium LWZ2-11]
MKKVLFFSMIAAGVMTGVQAQDFKNVQKAVLLKQTENAKTEIDNVMKDPKAQAKPEGWMYKAEIYAAIYKDPALKVKYPNAEVVADEAFQKYAQLDPSYKIMKDNGAQQAAFDLYGTSFNNGIRTFNSKHWDSASYFFKYAVAYSDVIFKNKWSENTNIAFDTTSILYAGYSSQNAQKPELALGYYTRLADNKVKGEGYNDIYKYILVSYSNQKNLDQFNKYLAIAKELYPKDNWEEYELDYFNRNYSLEQKAALYDKEDAAGTISFLKYMHYGDAFANPSKEDKAALDSAKLADYQDKASDAFKKASLKDATDGLSPFNVGVIAYTKFGIYDDRMRDNRKKLQDLNSNRPVEKDPKKKTAADAAFKAQADEIKAANATLEKPMLAEADKSIEWLEKAYNILKDKATRTNTEKNLLNKSVDFLANLYSYKRDALKGKDPKMYDVYDAKYKQFDALHDKF